MRKDFVSPTYCCFLKSYIQAGDETPVSFAAMHHFHLLLLMAPSLGPATCYFLSILSIIFPVDGRDICSSPPDLTPSVEQAPKATE